MVLFFNSDPAKVRKTDKYRDIYCTQNITYYYPFTTGKNKI